MLKIKRKSHVLEILLPTIRLSRDKKAMAEKLKVLVYNSMPMTVRRRNQFQSSFWRSSCRSGTSILGTHGQTWRRDWEGTSASEERERENLEYKELQDATETTISSCEKTQPFQNTSWARDHSLATQTYLQERQGAQAKGRSEGWRRSRGEGNQTGGSHPNGSHQTMMVELFFWMIRSLRKLQPVAKIVTAGLVHCSRLVYSAVK